MSWFNCRSRRSSFVKCFLSAAHTKLPFFLPLSIYVFTRDLEKLHPENLALLVVPLRRNSHWIPIPIPLYTIYIPLCSWGQTQLARSINLPGSLLRLAHGSAYRSIKHQAKWIQRKLPSHIKIKLMYWKLMMTKKILKAVTEKRNITYKRTRIRIKADFSSEAI